MAASGAKILHLRCVEYARRYDIPVHVRSSFSQKEGTWILPARPEGAQPMEQAIIAGIAHDRSEAKVTVVGVPDKVGVAARVFEALADAEINIDMVVQNISAQATGLTDISFTLPRADGQTAMAALAKLQSEVGYDRLMYDDEIGKVSLIGAGMRSHPGITARFFAALAERRHQHRDDLDLRDPHLGDRRRGRRRRRPSRPPTRRSTSTAPRSRRSSTAGPVADGGPRTSASSARPGRSAPRCARSSLEREFPIDSIRFFSSARSAGTVLPFGDREVTVEDAADRRRRRARPGALLRRRHGVASPRAALRRGRRHRGRQLVGLADGPRCPAGRLGGQPRRHRGLATQGDHRQPQLHHHGRDAGAQAAARRGRPHPAGRLDLPSGLRQRAGRRRGARRAAGRGG